jgi:hypothetical protein
MNLRLIYIAYGLLVSMPSAHQNRFVGVGGQKGTGNIRTEFMSTFAEHSVSTQ